MTTDNPQYRMPDEDRTIIQDIYSELNSQRHLQDVYSRNEPGRLHHTPEQFANKLAKRFFVSWCYDNWTGSFPSNNYSGETFDEFIKESKESLRIPRSEVLSRLCTEVIDIFHKENGSPSHMDKKSDIRRSVFLPVVISD